ncbi:MAG: SUMF1/EgtB/PvdO family nonheme iron enzyme [Bacteroidota bacterium]|nr:SUMF1/EgtB/PvdO family nonheme iron enzyme [Bacteroidota bacterium]
MKKLFSITLSALLSITALGQIHMKEIDESLVKIKDGLYASKYEVSNKLYITFLNSLKRSNKTNLLSIAQIDSVKWTDKLTYNEPYVHYYHSHPAYQNYPLVNISYEGADLYCAWLTEQYNFDKKRKFKKVLFRLPSEKEWILAAQAGDSSAIYPWEGKELRNKKGQVMYNYKRELKDTLWVDGKYIENVDVTAPIKSYWKNNFGLYNMSGNVAEMINEKGIVKGGSWKDDSEYLKIDTKNKYDGNAQTFVGFRYFAEILEE